MRTGLRGDVARITGTGNPRKSLFGRHTRKRQLWRSRFRRKYNIKMYFKETWGV